ncbi:membrane protein insertase YidC [Alphaproteobacteria bacterium]|nr:membrane protein insertase YidC [Alphaproteobacteria bacterium]MDC1120838.1 membrane protein insertase YidC [Alphaproteobacteria bacterium]
MTPENRNLIMAVALSMIVLLGWQIFVIQPEMEKEAAEQERIAAQMAQSATTANDTGQSSASAASGTPAIITNTAPAKAVDTAKRIVIDAPLVRGSFSLRGARLDDVILTSYNETLDENSENIHFLKKISSDTPFFAEFGWSSSDSGQAMPSAGSLWSADRDVLSPAAPVTLTWDNGQGLRFTRRISINDDYLFVFEDSVTSTLPGDITLYPYGLVRRHGTPATTGMYILHEGPLGVFDETLNEEDYDDLRDAGADGIKITPETAGGWVGITDKYWLAALLPTQAKNYNFGFQSLAGNADRYQVDFIDPNGLLLAAGGAIISESRLFAGAKKVALLDYYAEQLNIPNFDLAIDFGWFYFLTKPFFYAINWLFGLFGNFGVAVLAFTVLVKLVFFPLANKSYRSMAKMRLLAPKLKTLRERFGEDRQKLNQEMMALYKAEQVNPAAGCLPVLLQIPVFFALYKVLFVTIEMRHAPFFGWITDLSAPDPTSIFNMFGLLPYSVSFLPSFLQLGIWPILMGVSMFLQMRLNPAPPDPIQAKVFQFMPIFFTFLLATFPAGLVIYWTWNNLLSMAQQWYILKRVARG